MTVAAERLALSTALVDLSDLETLCHRQLLDLERLSPFYAEQHLDSLRATTRDYIERIRVTRLRLEGIVSAQAWRDDMIAGGTLGAP